MCLFAFDTATLTKRLDTLRIPAIYYIIRCNHILC
jgi:hypothetical protein